MVIFSLFSILFEVICGKWISNRILGISGDINHFNKTAPDYNAALIKNGFHEKITYLPSQLRQRNRKRQIIWCNLSYSVSAKTDVK